MATITEQDTLKTVDEAKKSLYRQTLWFAFLEIGFDLFVDLHVWVWIARSYFSIL